MEEVLAAERSEAEEAALMMAEEMLEAAVTGQMVVVTSMVSVIMTADAEGCPGQLVMLAAHE